MNAKFLMFLCVALLAVLAVSAEVEVLTTDSFDAFVAENEFVLVEFYAPWCGHCKNLEPHYNAASETLDGEGIKLAKVDATEEEALASRFEVRGFPTLVWFNNGARKAYSGGRETDDIVAWCRKNTGPAYTVLSSADEIASFRADNEVYVIGWMGEGASSTEAVQLIALMGSDALDVLPFALVTDAALLGDSGLEGSHNVEVHHPDHDTITLEVGAEHGVGSSVHRTLLFATVGTFSPLGAVFDRVQAADTSMMVAFVDEQEHPEEFASMKEWSKDLTAGRIGQLPITQVGPEFFERIEMLGGKQEDIPTVIITNLRKNWVFDKAANGLTKEAVASFIEDFLAGKSKAHFKSEPIPEEQQDDSVLVVGDTFEEVAMDTSKDVLMMFHAPWCGHCKALMPVYLDLASEMTEYDDIVIAHMDATANDHTSDVEIEGFPTVVLFRKGDNAAIPFEGSDRSLEALQAFVLEHHGHSADHDEL